MEQALPQFPQQQGRLRGDTRRTRLAIGVAVLVHVLLIAPSLLRMDCEPVDVPHDRPLGIPGGSGNNIAKGTPEGVKDAKGEAKPAQGPKMEVVKIRTSPELFAGESRRSRSLFMERVSGDEMLAILKSNRDGGMVGADKTAQAKAALDGGTNSFGEPGPLGLPRGVGGGPTAAGSPYGSRVGAQLWLYRVKHGGDNWDANPSALPALLREVNKALNVPVSDKQQVITLGGLGKHRGANFPSMLFMTGTGGVEANENEVRNLREYLNNGGLLVADSSGGSFEKQFQQFMNRVLPGKRFREVEFDHPVFRGQQMPYQMTHGCPVYRDHGSRSARGIFDDTGRLMVFFSPGDIGSAWAVTELGKKRAEVEQACQMGTNLVAYSLLTVRDQREK